MTEEIDAPEWEDEPHEHAPDANPLELERDDTADPEDRRPYRGHRPNAGLSDLTESGHGWMTDRHLDRFDPSGLGLDDYEPEALDVTPVRQNECPHCGDRMYPEAEEYVCRFAETPVDASVTAADGLTAPVPVRTPTDPAPVFRDAWNVPAPWANPDRGRSRSHDDPHGWTKSALSMPPYWTPDPAVKTETVLSVRAEPRPVLALPGQFASRIERCPVVALIRPLFDQRDDCQCSPCTLRRNPPQPVGQPRATCGSAECRTKHDTVTTAKRRAKRRVNDRLRAKAVQELQRFPGLPDRTIGFRLGIHRDRVTEARDTPGPTDGERFTWKPARPAPFRPPAPSLDTIKDRKGDLSWTHPSWWGPVVKRT